MFPLGRRPIRPAAPTPADVAAKLRRAPDDLGIVPGFDDTPPDPITAERDQAVAEVARLREQMARLTNLVADGLLAYSVDRRREVAADALLELRLALIPAAGSVPVIPGGAA